MGTSRISRLLSTMNRRKEIDSSSGVVAASSSAKLGSSPSRGGVGAPRNRLAKNGCFGLNSPAAERVESSARARNKERMEFAEEAMGKKGRLRVRTQGFLVRTCGRAFSSPGLEP